MKAARISNLVPSFPDDRDFIYQIVPGSQQPFISLRRWSGDRKNQLAEGSCTDNAAVNACELIDLQSSVIGPSAPSHLSRQFGYDIGRIWENARGQPGMLTRDALKVANKLGLPLEADWPYRNSEDTIDPPPAVIALAGQRKLIRYERIDMATGSDVVSLMIRSALFEGCPVVIAMAVGARIYGISGPLAQQDYPVCRSEGNWFIGNHAVCIEEWDDALGGYVAENSWGEGWGDDGFFLIKQAVLEQDLFEAWVVRGFNGCYIEPRFASDQQIKDVVDQSIADAGSLEVAAKGIWDAKVEYGIPSAHLEAVMRWPAGSVDRYARDHGWLL